MLFAAALASTDGICETRNPADLMAITPDTKPWVYWFWKNGNISREGITADLEAMNAVGIGGMIVMEVSLSVPPGPVTFFSDAWRDLFTYAVSEADRLGLKICINSAPGWTGSGGPWITPELSMKKVVASEVTVTGPKQCDLILEQPKTLQGFYRDIAVLAFPAPEPGTRIEAIEEKALYQRAPFSSAPNVRPHFTSKQAYPEVPAEQCIARDRVLEVSAHMDASGRFQWDVPEGRWTVMRIGYTSTGQTNRPAPLPGLECDKLSTAALDAHFNAYIRKLVEDAGIHAGRALSGTHFDSWEVGGQNWTETFPEDFQKRRGYDAVPWLPVMAGYVMDSHELSERFLWDLRQTVSEMIAEYHGKHMRELAQACGLTLSIEPYDMTPCDDMTLGAAADIPMCEFWSDTFDTRYSVREAVSVAHVYGKPVVAAEAFTSVDKWLLHPGAIKANGDWAFSEGVNKMVIHRYIHQPFAQARPGLSLGPHGLHYERTQTWWPYTGPWHAYLARCQSALRHVPTADLLYLSPEGAPNVFQGPDPAPAGYKYDACTPEALLTRIHYKDGYLTNGLDARYRLLVLPDSATMTPELLSKIRELVADGATVAGPPPLKSPSLSGYPHCDEVVGELAEEIWGGTHRPGEVTEHHHGTGRVVWGGALTPEAPAADKDTAIMQSDWIWSAEDASALTAPPGIRYFTRKFTLPSVPESADLSITADNAFRCWVNGKRAGRGDNFTRLYTFEIARLLRPGDNLIAVEVENTGDGPNPAGLIALVELEPGKESLSRILSDGHWQSASRAPDHWREDAGASVDWPPASTVGPLGMAPWGNIGAARIYKSLYPPSKALEALLEASGILPDFQSDQPLRFNHQRTPLGDLYFVSNGEKEVVEATCIFRVSSGHPLLVHPEDGTARPLPQLRRTDDGRTAISLRFEGYESYFILFDEPTSAEPGEASAANFPERETLLEIAGPWQVRFDTDSGGPEQPVTFPKLTDWASHDMEAIRYYAGSATYTCEIELPASLLVPDKSLFLDLGRVEIAAAVRLNGQDLGVAWKSPYRVAVGKVARADVNVLEVRVANLWVNRLIGDDRLPPDSKRKPDGTLKAWPQWLLEGKTSPTGRHSFATWRHWNREDPLQPSGLLGPVTLYRQ
jgi:hypothetical protein